MSNLTSNSLRMMEKSMDFLWAKQTAHIDNISNAETPGYKVKTVSFEDVFDARLRAATQTSKLSKFSKLSKSSNTGIATIDNRVSRKKVRQVIEDSSWTVDEDTEIVRMDENGVNVTEQAVESVRTAYQLQYVYQAISSDLTTLGKAINGS